MAVLAAAREPELPLASLTLVATPADLTAVPALAPPRPLLPPAPVAGGPGGLVGALQQKVAEVSVPWVGPVLTAAREHLDRPVVVARHLDDTDLLAQLDAVAVFTAETTAYAGRSFGGLFHRLLPGEDLGTGRVELDTGPVDLGEVRAPTLVVAGAADTIAPLRAVQPWTSVLTGAEATELEVVPGGHLASLTGRAARTTTWPRLDAWWERWD
jgi:polyhydroxyalkanoate synthase